MVGDGVTSAVGLTMAFAGGLALFLLGMDGVTGALRGLAGSTLRRWLERLTATRVRGVAAGVLVTATIQSSSVTVVLVLGFLSAGLLSLPAAVPVIIGANVGTTVTAQIVAFDVVGAALGMVAVGTALRLAGRREAVRQLGTGLAGLGVLFLGMGVMQDAVAPLRGSETVLGWLSADRGPVPGLLLGAGFTALVQSSSATIGVVVVMASQGLVPLETGVALVLGASLGTTVTALLGSIGRPRVALRAAVVHVVINAVGVTLLLLALTPLTDLAVWLSPTAADLTGTARLAAETPRQLANAYTIAKLAMAVGFIGLTPQLAALATRVVPPRDEERRVAPRYLDDAVLAAPSVALELARKEIVRLGRRVAAQLEAAVPAVLTGTATQLAELAAGDDDIDRLHREIVAYLRRIEERRSGEDLGRELVELLNVVSYLEIVGDVVKHDLARVGLRRIEEDIPVSDATRRVVEDFHRTMCGLLEEALRAFADRDAEVARAVLDAKPDVNELLRRAAEHHAGRISADAPRRVAAFARGTETIEHLRRVYTFAKRIARAVLAEDEGWDPPEGDGPDLDAATRPDEGAP